MLGVLGVDAVAPLPAPRAGCLIKKPGELRGSGRWGHRSGSMTPRWRVDPPHNATELLAKSEVLIIIKVIKPGCGVGAVWRHSATWPLSLKAKGLQARSGQMPTAGARRQGKPNRPVLCNATAGAARGCAAGHLAARSYVIVRTVRRCHLIMRQRKIRRCSCRPDASIASTGA